MADEKRMVYVLLKSDAMKIVHGEAVGFDEVDGKKHVVFYRDSEKREVSNSFPVDEVDRFFFDPEHYEGELPPMVE